jgi:kexin
VKDTQVNEHNGTFTDWHLKLWGESKDPAKAKNLPMPTEDDDKDHAVTMTTTLPATTHTFAPSPVSSSASEITANPSDHPDRPVNSKPTETTTPSEDETSSSASASATSTNSTWISFLPAFGMSAATQAWVYGALALVVIFCCGVGAYLFLARRKRLRNEAREDYQFELLDEEEAEGLASGEKQSRRTTRRTRGGELYDAFAGGSDEEDDEGDDDEESRPLAGARR